MTPHQQISVATPPPSLTPDAIIAALRLPERGHFPHAAFAAAIAQRELVMPMLLGELARTAEEIWQADEEVDDDRHEYWLFNFACHIAAAAEETAAFPLLLSFFRRTDEVAIDLTGDLVTEDLPMLLERTFDGDLESLKDFVFDNQVEPYTRSAGYLTLLGLAQRKRLPWASFLGITAELLDRQFLRPEDTFTELLLGAVVHDVAEPSLHASAKRFFDAGMIDGTIALPADNDRLLQSAAATSGTAAAATAEWTAADCEDRLARCFWFRTTAEEEAKAEARWAAILKQRKAELRRQAAPEPVYVSVRSRDEKIGRNEPCPCGSGKKFKKCCVE